MWTVISLFIGLLCTLISPTYSHGDTDNGFKGDRKFSASLSLLKGGYDSNGTVDRIVGGHDVKPGVFPGIGQIGYAGRGYLCGCTLISKDWVLSAAHCFDGDLKNSASQVRIADVDTSRNDEGATPVIVNIAKIIVHPKWNSKTFDNDMALIKLAKPVQPFTPLCQPTPLSIDKSYSDNRCPTNLDNVPATTAGWGATREGGRGTTKLQAVDIHIFSRKTCLNSYPSMNVSAICAGDQKGGKDSCQGDSGGPLYINCNSKFYQVGIVSYGRGCARPGYPGVYTNIKYFQTFINDVMKNY